MKYLIVGLGNIGQEYRQTRHNIGFEILDALAGASNVFFGPDRHADVTELKLKGKTLVLVKPTTYMNLSGKAVSYWMQKERIPLENVLVILDDLALPFGKLRLRANGSDGGHNGLKSIDQTLGTNRYARLRFGIGADFPKGRQSDYVLGRWTDEESEALKPRIELAIEAICEFVLAGCGPAMTKFNGV
jgi:peptidyl-tRNA hydrolase, PTH1 family